MEPMVDHNDNHYNTTSPLPTPTGEKPSMKDQEPTQYNQEISSDLTEPINSTGYQINHIPSASDTNPKIIKMIINQKPLPSETIEFPNTPPFITNLKTDKNKKPKNGTKHQPPNLPNLHPTTTGPSTSLLAGTGTPWISPQLRFSTGRATDLPNHPEPSPSGKGNNRSTKQWLGDAWSSNVAVSHGADPSSQLEHQQRFAYSRSDSSDLQQYPFSSRTHSRGSICNISVQNIPAGINPENFTFTAGEASTTTITTTSIAAGEHRQRNLNSTGDTEEQRHINGPRSNTNRQYSQSGLTVSRNSKGGGVQRGPQRNTDPTVPKESSSLRNGPIISH
ncbi:hypothetical protein A4A49_02754 [Nicotiana attenuata]|uniref:Uncharacterized protein n=1 Tax=Nicotiana attenuata TaxID=49451 RepID=A0A1J6J2N8_NICAT|nr:hypothetical protein A4A49_02754 [Nicotiana attenuata]